MPLSILRKKLLDKQERFMNLRSDEETCALSAEDVARELNKYNVGVGDNPHQQLMQLD